MPTKPINYRDGYVPKSNQEFVDAYFRHVASEAEIRQASHKTSKQKNS